MLRLYWPKDTPPSIIDGTWKAPAVAKTDSPHSSDPTSRPTHTTENAMKKHTAAILVASALVAAPLAVAPSASADICAGAGGRHFSAGGCTNIAGDIATGAAIASAHVAYIPGEIPCYTVEGVLYFTPPGDPC
ncbi:hypothetical protein [Mycolicibacterium setense]